MSFLVATVSVPIGLLAIDDQILPPLFTLLGNSWFFQGMLVNGTFALVTIPFSNKAIQNSIFRQKKKRIINANEDLKTYCLQILIKEEKINKEEFNNKLFIIANKYDIEIKDLFADEKQFFLQLAKSIVDVDLIDEKSKENIIYEIRNKKIFIDSSNDSTIYLPYTSQNYSDINDKKDNNKNTDVNYEENLDDNIKFSQIDKKNILRLTSIVTGIIFISLFIFTSFIQLVFKYWGINAIILINTIATLIILFPIFINGLLHLEELDVHTRRIFYLLFICFLFIIANLVCIFSTLL